MPRPMGPSVCVDPMHGMERQQWLSVDCLVIQGCPRPVYPTIVVVAEVPLAVLLTGVSMQVSLLITNQRRVQSGLTEGWEKKKTQTESKQIQIPILSFVRLRITYGLYAYKTNTTVFLSKKYFKYRYRYLFTIFV